MPLPIKPPVPKIAQPIPPSPPTSLLQRTLGTPEVSVNARLAINLFDLERVTPEIRSLFAKDLDLTTPIWIDRNKPDEYGVVFTCNLLKAATICDVIRTHDAKVGDYLTRVYVCKKIWSKLPRETMLTIIEDSKCVLNPAYFVVPVVLAPIVKRAPKRVEF